MEQPTCQCECSGSLCLASRTPLWKVIREGKETLVCGTCILTGDFPRTDLSTGKTYNSYQEMGDE